jgi:hypothetical protein
MTDPDICSWDRSFLIAESIELPFMHPDFVAFELSREVGESRLMRLIARGWLQMAAASRAMGVSRSTVLRRCRREGIDPKAARAAYLKRLLAHIKREAARQKKAKSPLVLRVHADPKQPDPSAVKLKRPHRG